VTSLRLRHLELSAWPFGLILLPEILGALLIMRGAPDRPRPLDMLTHALVAATVGFVVAAVAIWIAKRFITVTRSARWRSVPVALVIYCIVAVVSGAVMAMLIVVPRGGMYPVGLLVLWTVTRPISIIVLAIIVQLVRDGVSASRDVDVILQEKLSLARSTNATLEAAESALRAESRRVLADEVATPLGEIVRTGSTLNDLELADRIDDFISTRLRPMAHVLHPVSVRLGLIPAMRSLDPTCLIDADHMIERMDADGDLLDDDVRLQVYRWIRENLPDAHGSRTHFVIRGRDLEVSMHPSNDRSLDAVHLVAGIRRVRAGVIVAPLRGQVADWADIAPDLSVYAPPRRERYRLRDLLTVPLPHRLLLVVLLSLGAAPLQFIVYRWNLTLPSIVASLGLGVAPVVTAALLGRLPAPRATVLGAWRVVGEWFLIAMTGVLGVAIPATMLGLFPNDAVEWLAMTLRMSYRYLLPGLAVVVSHGLFVVAQRRLEQANEALMHERERRAGILAESQRVDRDVAEALHRTVQGRLAAAVVMLRLGERPAAWDQVVGMATEEVPELLGRLSEGASYGLVIDRPIGLSIVQVGDVTIRGDMLDDIRSVVGEIALNARRHGHASSLLVQVTHQEGRYTIICDDDGTGIAEQTTPGLGSRLLDETMSRYGGTWRFEPSRAGCRVVLEVPAEVSRRGLASSVV
jgi:multisubunit Na+/H+ antiporter MnhE subunit